MADDHHHQIHRPHRLSLPSRATVPTTIATPRPYPSYPYPPSTPTPTPSKQRLSILNRSPSRKSSLSFLFLLLFSLRSLYSLLPFLRSSPSSFSIFPFSFLVSLLSFLLTLSFSLFTPSSSSKDPFRQKHQQQQPILSLTLITQSQHRLLVAKSLLLAIVFLLRFQALRYCGTAAMILAELSGNVAARFLAEGRNRDQDRIGSSKVRGFFNLFLGMLLLSISWDRVECFPFSAINLAKLGFSVLPSGSCVRIWPMLLPFLSGFLGCYERVSLNWVSIRELGRKRIRLISLFYTTVVLFIPAVISMFLFEADGESISFGGLGWPLANTVVFGVLLTENYSDEKLASSRDFQKEFFVTVVCTLLLELFYFPELSLWGLLICGVLIGIAVRELDPVYSNYLELGLEPSESLTTLFMKSMRHILSERKSRKIALFLLINAGYMVVEFGAGFMSNSLGLISDACHMLFDCAALAIGLYASYISRLPANSQFNYGRGRFEVLSGYVNAVFLVLVGALIVLESFERILDPQEISTNSLLTVSIGGLVVNVVGLIFFHDEHHQAHGGTGSCSHSHSHLHSHSHSHSHSDSHSHAHQHHHHSYDHAGVPDHKAHGNDHSHDHNGHDHITHGNQHERIHVSHDCNDKLCSGLGKSCSDTPEHRDCNHQPIAENAEFNKTSCAKCHGDDHHEHVHNHGQHEHVHNRDHHGHHHHLQHHHDHADQHIHGSTTGSSSISFNIPSVEGYSGGYSHVQGNLHSCGHGSESSTSQQKEIPSHREELKRHHHHIDHNMEGIFLHVLADTLGSVGVVISTLLIKYKGWLVADPACSIFISVLIVSSVIPLLRNSAEILLQRVPRAHEQDLKEAIKDIVKIKGVRAIQNLHVWNLTNTEVVGSLHLHFSTETDKASAKAKVSHMLHDAGIKDLTVQVECLV